MVTDTQTDPAALMSQALHDFIHLTALEIQALHFFCAIRSVNRGKDAHGLHVGFALHAHLKFACTDRLYSLCNAFNDNMHHWVIKCSVCCVQSRMYWTYTYTCTDRLQQPSSHLHCLSKGKVWLQLNRYLHGKSTSLKHHVAALCAL